MQCHASVSGRPEVELGRSTEQEEWVKLNGLSSSNGIRAPSAMWRFYTFLQLASDKFLCSDLLVPFMSLPIRKLIIGDVRGVQPLKILLCETDRGSLHLARKY
jgi:hypothetical protein